MEKRFAVDVRSCAYAPNLSIAGGQAFALPELHTGRGSESLQFKLLKINAKSDATADSSTEASFAS